MFGIMGSHRSGKTTLAKAISRQTGIRYFSSSTTQIMKEGGFDGVADMPIVQRIAAQEWLLLRYMEIIDTEPRPFITDRTPIDMASYLLAEVTMHNTPVELGPRIKAYVNSCVMASHSLFDTMIITRPLAEYVAEPDKPPPNLAFQQHIQVLIEGLGYQMMANGKTVALLTSTELESRINASCDLIGTRFKDAQSGREFQALH